jgi:hypothetical protein
MSEHRARFLIVSVAVRSVLDESSPPELVLSAGVRINAGATTNLEVIDAERRARDA